MTKELSRELEKIANDLSNVNLETNLRLIRASNVDGYEDARNYFLDHVKEIENQITLLSKTIDTERSNAPIIKLHEVPNMLNIDHTDVEFREENGKTIITIKVPPTQYDALEKEANELGLSVNELMSDTFQLVLKEEEEKKYKRWRRHLHGSSKLRRRPKRVKR